MVGRWIFAGEKGASAGSGLHGGGVATGVLGDAGGVGSGVKSAGMRSVGSRTEWRSGGFRKRARCSGHLGQSFLYKLLISDPTFQSCELRLGGFPERGYFAAQLFDEAAVAIAEVDVDGRLPLVQPISEFAFQPAGGGRFLGRFGGGNLLDLLGETTDFFAEIIRGRGGGGRQRRQRMWLGFQRGDALFERREFATDEDFADSFDGGGWVGWW